MTNAFKASPEFPKDFHEMMDQWDETHIEFLLAMKRLMAAVVEIDGAEPLPLNDAFNIVCRLHTAGTRLGLTLDEKALVACDLIKDGIMSIDDLREVHVEPLGLFLDERFKAQLQTIFDNTDLPAAVKAGDTLVALALQECEGCGKVFAVEYEGRLFDDFLDMSTSYRYLGTPCDCDCEFTAVGTTFSIGEWRDTILDTIVAPHRIRYVMEISER